MTTRKKNAAGGEPAARRRRVNRHTYNPIIDEKPPTVKKCTHNVLQPLLALWLGRLAYLLWRLYNYAMALTLAVLEVSS